MPDDRCFTLRGQLLLQCFGHPVRGTTGGIPPALLQKCDLRKGCSAQKLITVHVWLAVEKAGEFAHAILVQRGRCFVRQKLGESVDVVRAGGIHTDTSSAGSPLAVICNCSRM